MMSYIKKVHGKPGQHAMPYCPGSTYYLEYGRHVARLYLRRRRRRACAPTRNIAGHDNVRKSIHEFPLFPYMGMGLRLAGLRAAGAPLSSRYVCEVVSQLEVVHKALD